MYVSYFCRLLAIALCALLASCGETNTQQQVQPHVILITAGDLAQSDLSAYGGPIPTPNIERIVQKGVLFTQGYAAAAQAGPSRAALASGQYPQRFGFMFDTGPVRPTIRDNIGMPDTITMVQERLRALGYKTAMFGSWNLGARPEFYATKRGFDYFWGTLGDSTAYIAPREEGVVFTKTARYRLPPSRSRFNTVFSGALADTVNNNKRYLTDDMGDKVADYIERIANDASTAPSEDKPLFLWAAFHAPRAPLTALEEDFDGLPDLGSKERNTYGAMVRALDRNIGKILDALEAAGAADNALIVFTADRGCDALAGTCPCEGLRGGAPSVRQGGLIVPFIAAFPGGKQAGTSVDVPVMPFDITATIMDYADPEDRLLPEFDGRSLTELLEGKLRRFEQRPLFWQQTPLVAMLMNGQKLVANGEDNVPELFDLSVDPQEQNDIASANAYAVSDMETRLDVWQQANTYPKWLSSTYKSRTVCGTKEYIIEPPR
ncbi:MAG: sulfatase-like hydrolase/transferase [Pseudomonadota bacterium]